MQGHVKHARQYVFKTKDIVIFFPKQRQFYWKWIHIRLVNTSAEVDIFHVSTLAVQLLQEKGYFMFTENENYMFLSYVIFYMESQH